MGPGYQAPTEAGGGRIAARVWGKVLIGVQHRAVRSQEINTK